MIKCLSLLVAQSRIYGIGHVKCGMPHVANQDNTILVTLMPNFVLKAIVKD
eukprot:CAMPEP_0182803318 /NCGR_PEP_ID=MMETSP0006_2-20121128/3966_1 /TAXON_ID=97485 /ORGANISM="Prymnesium parvum, Strain Texoma1" /LENGTH=50 /DNA_ID=CAMNT_0024928787 /DNA_START=117 /DNA_END=269 /DNA_ORIENTATION=+